MERGSVVAVILTYNRKNLLLEVLDALLHQDAGMPDVLIVNNHSTDGTEQAVAPWLSLSNVHYENTGSNLGGAGGFHYAIKQAVLMGYNRLWIMDDDCIPESGALSALLKADQDLNGDFGWLSSLAYWTDGSLCKLNEHDYKLGKRIRDFSKRITPAITASFVSLYLPAETVLRFGLNLKEFYMWADDWEFTRRISRETSCYLITDSRVTHKTAHNRGNNIAVDSVNRLWRYRFAYRNEVYVLKRDGLFGFLHWILKLGLHTVRILFQSPLRGGKRIQKLWILYSSAWRGLFFHPQVEYIDRALIHPRKVVHDEHGQI